MKHNYNASLKYKDVDLGTRILHIWVMDYDQPFQLAGTEEQSKFYQHFYSKSYAPGDMKVTGRVAYQSDYNRLAEFIRAHHMTLMNSPGANNSFGDFIPLMELSIPSESLTVAGIIKSFEAGAKRFNVAPQYTFDMMVIKNRQSTKIISEYAIRNAWTGKFVGSAPTNAQSSGRSVPIAPPPQVIHNHPTDIP